MSPLEHIILILSQPVFDLNAACLVEKQQILNVFPKFFVWSKCNRGSNPRSTAYEANMPTITPPTCFLTATFTLLPSGWYVSIFMATTLIYIFLDRPRWMPNTLGFIIIFFNRCFTFCKVALIYLYLGIYQFDISRGERLNMIFKHFSFFLSCRYVELIFLPWSF